MRFQDCAPYLVRVDVCKVDENLNQRVDRATKGKWGIPDWKGESSLMSDLELKGSCPRLCRLRTALVGF
jgi:hypothetical protein